MAIIQLVNGPQLHQAKVCELCPGKVKIWPESKFYAHLKETHGAEKSRRCGKCGQLKAEREFRNPFIQSCNACLGKRARVDIVFRRKKGWIRSQHNKRTVSPRSIIPRTKKSSA
ncbi:MAG: hypothetical protein IH857_01140 [Deltaproteobacteria bacterium]|nr:hypothetical protein [Deltaproteobacteria bacterium]